MCGIVGYIGKKEAKQILIEGLLKLEYRGYDSAGLAVINKENKIECLKCKGRVKNLIEDASIKNVLGSIGIAHTRWATHGEPSTRNSHPHLDNTGKIAVVHNGIIENYIELKNFLIEKNYAFLSETDTEVIPNLIDYYYKLNNNNLLEAVKQATDDLVGSYALEIISVYNTDEIIVARKDSPLVIGKGKGENYICSDIPAVLSYTNEFYYLDEKEFAVVSKDSIKFFDTNLERIAKVVKVVELENTAAEKGNFEDYMLKEIFEQPRKVRDSFDINNIKDFNLSNEYLKTLNKIVIVACGTSMHVGLVVENTFEFLCGIETNVEIASEFRYRNPIMDEKTLAIFISQSGETADTIAALKLAKLKNARTLAITNVIGSSITREADFSIYTCAGPEIAVASTKAYTAQIALLTLVALDFAKKLKVVNNNILEEIEKEIMEIPSKINLVLENKDMYYNCAKEILNSKDIFFLGRGIDYAVAQEGALKLKEISYIHAESYASGELKHGPIALIEKNVPVIGIITEPNLVEKSLSNIQEVITRGAKTIIVTNQDLDDNNYDYIIKIPKCNRVLSPILSVIPLQLLSYYVAKEKKLDVDKPRNLAKSVTVE